MFLEVEKIIKNFFKKVCELAQPAELLPMHKLGTGTNTYEPSTGEAESRASGGLRLVWVKRDNEDKQKTQAPGIMAHTCNS